MNPHQFARPPAGGQGWTNPLAPCFDPTNPGPRVPPVYTPAELAADPPPSRNMHTSASNIQNRIQQGNTYGHLVASAPVSNITPPTTFDIGLIEICAYFPNWFQLPDVITRALRNGWKAKDIAKAQLHAMGQLNIANLKQVEARLRQQISYGVKNFAGLQKGDTLKTKDATNAWEVEDDLTGNIWQLRSEYKAAAANWEDMLLVTIAQPGNAPRVVNAPAGLDRLLTTQCIDFAVQNPTIALDTSHWEWILQRAGLQRPALATADHDNQALTRLRANVPDPTT